MQEINLELEAREITGKAVKQLRTKGLIPAVIHDHGKQSVHVMAQYVALMKAYHSAGKNHPINLTTGKTKYVALIKHVDFDPQKHLIRHVVFNAVDANEQVTAEVPIRIKFAGDNDSTPAERASLVVLHQLESVEVEALASGLPEALYFDGEKLVAVGDHATVADLIVPKGVVVKTDPSHPIATVFEPGALQAANDAAGGDATADAPAADADAAAAEGDAKPDDKKE